MYTLHNIKQAVKSYTRADFATMNPSVGRRRLRVDAPRPDGDAPRDAHLFGQGIGSPPLGLGELALMFERGLEVSDTCPELAHTRLEQHVLRLRDFHQFTVSAPVTLVLDRYWARARRGRVA